MIIHNTFGGEDQEFVPEHPGRVHMFVCGPTVYDDSHIGHARTNIFFDVMVKYLRARGYSVFYLQNITDIDDKIIKRANEEGKKYSDISDYYFRKYLSVMKSLRIDSINYYARASLYIDEIIGQIKRIMEAGYAYETADGVYFKVRKFSDYGKLSGQNMDEIRANARGTINEEKEYPEDFALWKKMKPGEPYWESPWGRGRPGWHIEDTAITEAYFGTKYDIHGGGSDLIFPHHEAEIAQMRSISGEKYLAHYWIHTGMVNINSEKMSKSLKNFIKTADVLERYRPEVLRLAMVNSNYNTVIDYSEQLMEESRNSVEKINILYRKLKDIGKTSGVYEVKSKEIIHKLNEIMDRNFDTRSLIRELLSFVSDLNKNLDNMGSESAVEATNVLEYVDSFLCILYSSNTDADKIIKMALDVRNIARKEKNYQISDYIRQKLQENNIYIEDNGDKTTYWSRS
ncbi:MAG: cysteine--tRNA ligase [Ferroplasma sp.]|uniref:cysteine--tRNA ligase n=1 Tax=Ferroplasma sp. TaxID=2591003 RepID=UPI002815B96C|nr:cysteine--tRNA ligase [Ferroplasma sp.]WMT50876.1 MAG: cysteine--tRNA ligase [Ferroplasma sp.]